MSSPKPQRERRFELNAPLSLAFVFVLGYFGLILLPKWLPGLGGTAFFFY